jgi:hypothetical protein
MRFPIAAVSSNGVSTNPAQARKRVAFLPRRLLPGLNAVAPAPICGQQIGQMET